VTAAALSVLGLLTVLGVPFWRELPPIPKFRLRAGLLLVLGVVALAVAAWLALAGPAPGRLQRELAVALSILASLVCGGPIARALLRLADQGSATQPQGPAKTDVLTGGAWIGALERIAITITLLARWPEGLALILAIKGLGRYPELRNADQPGIAERFIIGTFGSALWAAACAGVGLAVLH
jgi:hypothetical protein